MADRQPIPGQSVALNRQQMKNLITQIKEITIDRVLVLRSETYAALKRLEVERDTSKEWKGNPDGSRQFDSGTTITWLRSIHKDDEKAIAQLVVIDATCCARGT